MLTPSPSFCLAKMSTRSPALAIYSRSFIISTSRLVAEEVDVSIASRNSGATLPSSSPASVIVVTSSFTVVSVVNAMLLAPSLYQRVDLADDRAAGRVAGALPRPLPANQDHDRAWPDEDFVLVFQHRLGPRLPDIFRSVRARIGEDAPLAVIAEAG